MPKSRILQIIRVLFLALTMLCIPIHYVGAQSLCLEFKAGAVANNTFNDGVEDKTIVDSKLGIYIGAGLGYVLRNDMFRTYLECYYSGKGEKYAIDEFHILNSDVDYLVFSPNFRFYSPYFPVYLGVGMYLGAGKYRNFCEGSYVPSGVSANSYYKLMDFGPRASFGTELGVGSVRVIFEAAYEFGFSNISNNNEFTIKNRSLTVSTGLSFMIEGKHFRHY